MIVRPDFRDNRCHDRLFTVQVESQGGKAKLVLPSRSFASTHPKLTARTVFANAQDLFLFNTYVASQPRFRDPLYQEYCVDKFQKFLALQKDFLGQPLVPTPCIDVVIQAYLIRPLQLEDLLLSSNFTLHSRNTGFAPASKEALAETAKLWNAKYQCSYDDPLSVPSDFVSSGVPVEIDLAADCKMYQDFGVQESDFFAITNSQYAQCFTPCLGNQDVVSLVVSYAQDREPGQLLCAAYQRFLKWIVFLSQTKNVSPHFVPVGLTDYVWHAHLLRHTDYFKFSDDLLGRQLAHEPSSSTPSKDCLSFSHCRAGFYSLFKLNLDAPLTDEFHVPGETFTRVSLATFGKKGGKCLYCPSQIPAFSLQNTTEYDY